VDRRPALLFDVDGTLVDSVYQHVAAWCEVLEHERIDFPVWRIHRRIGMGGDLFVEALLRDTGRPLAPEGVKRLLRLHDEAFAQYARQIRALPGARELLRTLAGAGVPWALATSGRRQDAGPALEALGLPFDAPIVTGDDVPHAKPHPDLFVAAAERLGVSVGAAIVVGDSVWDFVAARRGGARGVGLLSGGYGADELTRAGACEVYQDPADLLQHLGELGVGDGGPSGQAHGSVAGE
jgi:HAD superfamily hydrolase (TIGR01549 family)